LTLELKHSVLTAIYEVYEDVAKGFPSACRRDCRACCTQNVLATTLEVEVMLEDMEKNARGDLLEKIRTVRPGTRLQPMLTINALAGYCLRREEPPFEDEEFGRAACALREPAGCAIYRVRPFSCRCLWSEQLCEPVTVHWEKLKPGEPMSESEGEATMSPVLVTLNGVFQQILEHVDAGGLYGNMIDLVCVLAEPEARAAYRAGKGLKPTALVHATRPNPGFLVPPQHRQKVMSALNLLWQKPVGNLKLREALQLLRGGCKA